jgi:hypothetical protein
LPAVPTTVAGTPRQVTFPITRVVAVALLLALTGSFWSPLTLAVLRIVPVARGRANGVIGLTGTLA